MRVGFYFFLLAASVLARSSASAQLIVSPQQTAQQIAQAIGGAFVTITNPTLNCADSASGTFTVGPLGSNLGMADGAIFTNGRAKTTASANGVDGPESHFAANANNWPGDPHITQLAGAPSFNACVFECDIKAAYDTLVFEYVFGSEEYQWYSCTNFNDAFGFFISGPGIGGTDNLALIPGTAIPVAINSTTDTSVTHPFTVIPCQNMGAGSPFAQYYNNNSNGTSVTYFGMTQVMQVIRKVDTGATYHLKFVVADVGDQTLDAGVFIKGNSITSRPAGGFPPASVSAAEKLSIEIAPNPFDDALTLNLPAHLASVQMELVLHDATGQVVNRFFGIGSKANAHLNSVAKRLQSGLYFLHMSAPQLGVSEVKKLQKK